jgi:hypothetical protein
MSGILSLYVVEHPRSGGTWLCRLLSDVLKADYIDGGQAVWIPQYWGVGEKRADYVVIKKHSQEALPGPTVFIYRDPRDVFTSQWHFRGGRDSIVKIIHNEANPDKNRHSRNVGRYRGYMEAWYNTGLADVQISYEQLHEFPVIMLDKVIKALTGKSWDVDAISDAVKRQEISKLKAEHPELGNSVWMGKVGNWRTYFGYKEARLAQEYFGDILIEQGYELSHDWVDLVVP